MRNKVMILVGLIYTWVVLMIGPFRAVNDLDLSSAESTSYTNCIKSLREVGQDAKLKYFDIPMLPAPSSTLKPKYLMVGLKSDKVTITIAIQRQNLYVLGYADQDPNGNARAHFFQDVPKDVRNELFKEATIRLELSFESSYQSIESKAGVQDRSNFGLGIKKLKNRIEKVYKADIKKKDVQKNQAEMFLIAIQIISEATRFRYIENQVKSPEHFDMFEFKPDKKFITLENRWGKLSRAIRWANPKTGEFTTGSVALVKPDGSNFEAKNVNQVNTDITLLNYVA